MLSASKNVTYGFIFCFGFLLGFLINWLCAVRVCSQVRWSNWLLCWLRCFACGLWSVLWWVEFVDPYWCISIFCLFFFLDKSVILLKQCLIYFWNSPIGSLLPFQSWLCGMVWNSNFVLFFLYGESKLILIIFSHKPFFLLIFVLLLSILTFSAHKYYQNFISSFTFAISFYRISTSRLYMFVEEGER